MYVDCWQIKNRSKHFLDCVPRKCISVYRGPFHEWSSIPLSKRQRDRKYTNACVQHPTCKFLFIIQRGSLRNNNNRILGRTMLINSLLCVLVCAAGVFCRAARCQINLDRAASWMNSLLLLFIVFRLHTSARLKKLFHFFSVKMNEWMKKPATIKICSGPAFTSRKNHLMPSITWQN